MKKALALVFSAVILLFGAAVPTPRVSAAAGTDVQETFEFYKSQLTFNSLWTVSEGKEAVKLSIDSTDSAPNRANGAAKGNYRCLKIELDMVKAEQIDKSNGGKSAYMAFDGKLEDITPIVESVKKNDTSACLSFYAKATKPIKFWVGLNVCDNIYYNIPIINSTDWKEYKIPLGDFKAWKGQNNVGAGVSEGETLFDVCKRSGFYTTQDAEFRGYKFAVLTSDQPADWPNGYKGTLKIDTLAFKGSHCSENGDEDMDLDKDGKKPDNFKPVTSSSNSGGTNNPSSNTSTSNGTSSGSTTTSGTGSTSSESSDSSDVTGSDPVSSEDSSLPDGSDPDESNASSETDADNTDNGKKESKKNAAVWIIAAAAIVVLAGAGAAVYFIYRKKNMNPESEDDIPSDKD